MLQVKEGDMSQSEPLQSRLKTTGAAVLNDKGQILPYTVQSTVSQCQELAVELWGEDVWQRLQKMGARIIQVEISQISI